MDQMPEPFEWRDPEPMTLKSRVMASAEAIVAVEQCRIDMREFADEVRATLPPGSEADRWPRSK